MFMWQVIIFIYYTQGNYRLPCILLLSFLMLCKTISYSDVLCYLLKLYIHINDLIMLHIN